MSLEDRLYKYLYEYKKLPDWAKTILVSPLKILPRSYYLGKNYKKFISLADSFEFVDSNKIEEYQFNVLKELLIHSFKTVPYYKETWQKLNINLNQIQNLQDFAKMIPFVTKEIVQKMPEKFISSLYSRNKWMITNTGGSTGIPLKLYNLKGYCRAAEWGHMHVLWDRIGFVMGQRLARLRGDYIGKNRLYSYDPWRNFLILSSFNLNQYNADYYIDLLDKYKIEYINAFPASIFNLIQLSKFEKRKVPSLKVIFLGSENIFDWQLEKIREFFEVERIYYWYGNGELSGLGGGCEKSSDYHFLPTYSFIELCNTDHIENSSSIKIKEIVGTSFINPLMPLIRYKTQDFGIENSKKCSCGRNHLLLKRIIGREQEIAVGFDNRKITLTALVHGRHSEYFNHCSKIQIVNTEPGKLVVRVVPQKSFNESHSKEIISNLSREEGMPFETKVEIVNSIETTVSGKHRFLIRNFEFNG